MENFDARSRDFRNCFTFMLLICMLVFIQRGDGMEPNALPEIEFKVSVDKRVFLLSEDIAIRVTFKNSSDNDLFVNTAFNFLEEETYLKFQIKKPNGEYALFNPPLMGKRPLLSEKDFRLIKKKTEYNTEVLINKWYDLNMVGEYEIVGEYCNRNDGRKFNLKPFWKFWGNNPRVFTATVFSNKVTFAIK